VRYRRSASLVFYWSDGRPCLENYARRSRTAAAPLVLEVLDFLDEWRSLTEIESRFEHLPKAPLRRLLSALVRGAFVQSSAARRPPRAAPDEDAWAPWNPAAGFLHFSTKDVPFVPDYEEGERDLRRHARRHPMPPAVKRYPRARFLALPPPAQGALPDLLRARRTWRRFAPRPLAEADLATLLGLTFGIQGWMPLGELGRVPLKTSPSGGARHSIEAYVLARRVRGLAPGVYHYVPDRHGLSRLRRGATPAQIESYLPSQWWYRGASAIVFMTTVVPRVTWRYDHPRAYRAVLIEAGHLCQTFLLVATWLGLAPFCSMALADSRVEKDLGIDGVTETVLYAAGVGARPPGLESGQAPKPRRGARR
jgi:SagB-type dehydrogenase family enzyme